MKIELTDEEYWALRDLLSSNTKQMPDPVGNSVAYEKFRALERLELKLHREYGNARNPL